MEAQKTQDWRYKKTGPEFIKFGGRTVRYPLKAVIGYEEKATKHPQEQGLSGPFDRKGSKRAVRTAG